MSARSPSPETGKDGQPILTFAGPAEFEQWLAENFASCPRGIWIKFAKKASGIPSVNYAQALDASLCYGWIDGQVKSVDEAWYIQKFTPRRPRSKWSQRNREHIARLTAAGLMRAAGLKEVEGAQADGRWDDAYASPRRIQVPDDFAAALNASPAAKAFFETLRGSNRYSVLYRLHDAKRPETRQRRIAEFITMLEAGKTFH